MSYLLPEGISFETETASGNLYIREEKILNDFSSDFALETGAGQAISVAVSGNEIGSFNTRNWSSFPGVQAKQGFRLWPHST
jgi:hypothetical protein